MSVLQPLVSTVINSELIYDCHIILTQVCMQKNNITIQWMTGHSGSRGNNAADELAMKRSEACATGPEPIVLLLFNWLWINFRINFKSIWLQTINTTIGQT